MRLTKIAAVLGLIMATTIAQVRPSEQVEPAKLSESALADPPAAQLGETRAQIGGTEPGMILGTVAYMSLCGSHRPIAIFGGKRTRDPARDCNAQSAGPEHVAA